jgi:hypothetical protein
LPPDQAFFGVGWATLHSDLTRPDADLMVLFKSSPFGPVSHSHADQNSFAVMYGGRALAIPGGERYPQHGTPFHEEYTQLTLAHNTLLLDRQGQVNRDSAAAGRLVGFHSTPHLGYVSGDATACYDLPLEHFVRHVVLIRPSIILILDDVAGPEPLEIAWLMHSKERLELEEANQSFTSHRRGASMKVNLFATGGFEFHQTDAWPVEPKQDYPMVTAPEPARQWHFTATSRRRAHRQRIAAVMVVSDSSPWPQIAIRRQGPADNLEIKASFPDGDTSVRVNLDANRPTKGAPLVEIRYRTGHGEVETLVIPPTGLAPE